MIIDTHLHVIDRTALHYPWLAGVPALDRDFPYETYRREAERVGIAQALHMEVDVDPADIDAETRYVAGLEKRPESLIVGAIAACRPEDPGFDATLAAAKADPLVKGLRRVLHVMPDELSEAPAFRANIARLAGSGLTFDLCVLPRQIGRAAALADLAPGATFVLDHCGVPDIRSGDAAAWLARRSPTSPAGRTSPRKFPAWSPMPTPPTGPSPRSGRMSSTRSKASAGTGWCGAATGRSARWAAAYPPGSPQRTRCLKG